MEPPWRARSHAEMLLARAKAAMVYVLTRVERRKTKTKKKSKKKMAKFKGDSKETPLLRRLILTIYTAGFFNV